MPRDLHPADQQAVENAARNLGETIAEILEGQELPSGRPLGFCLLTFDMVPDEDAEPGFLGYMSSAARGDMVALLREFADMLEEDGR